MDMEGHCKFSYALDDAELWVSMPTAPVEISECVTALESMPSSSITEVVVASTSGCDPSPSHFISSRIERMMQRQSEYGSEYGSAVEFEIAASKDHWSQLETMMSGEEEENETDFEVFQDLRLKWGGFFHDFEVFQDLRLKWGGFFHDFGDRLVVGEKIAEGGQAEIYEALVVASHLAPQYYGLQNYGSLLKDLDVGPCVLKVFKEGWALQDLQKQWPHGMLHNSSIFGGKICIENSCSIEDATMLKNGRFAFRMRKYWGDLRKLIELRMKHNDNQSAPFTNKEVENIVVQITLGMRGLHRHNIIHRDLKASNVLINPFGGRAQKFDPIQDGFYCDVADFECSVGVVGTGYWRAPEILHALQIRDIKPHLFSEKSDVYGFAMTCYEVLTGCIPFEGVDGICFDSVIDGKRPQLPNHVHPLWRTLLNSCWHANPSERPSFEDIAEDLIEIYPEQQKNLEF